MHLHPSTKSDNYLNLCLEQASLSPLTFRHGSVIVKGGKVIGAGFNDYRPGFNGGTLKTGALNNSNTATSTSSSSNNSGTAAALSMHSEMMAIHAALGNKAAAMRGTRPLLSNSSAKQSRVAVEEYVEAVLRAAGRPSNGRPASMTEIAEGGNGEKNGKNGDARSGRKGGRKKQTHASATNSNPSFTDSDDSKSDDDCLALQQNQRGSSRSSSKTARNRSMSPNSGPNGPGGQRPKAKPNVQHRKRHPRLAGADLYVARLGKPGACHRKTPSTSSSPPASPDLTSAAARVVTSTTATGPTPLTGSLHDELIFKHAKPPCATPTTASPPVSTGDDSATATSSIVPPSKVAESRPCYRCIAYMHSVGIKRVFWTNSDGVWEGAKVRDLVDSLEAAAQDGSGGGLSSDVGGMFVTKHEVLLLLRALAEGST
ncbi:hypothetical protein SBRCBS47491_005911 [Sporothrix bragantina]|uniref:CMP/dCMP-type deaminase domain-containing protein n=1 Tax=Sporothrix bragantina TaxID=671064 RepID=A0ABP0C0H1_9PEZI